MVVQHSHEDGDFGGSLILVPEPNAVCCQLLRLHAESLVGISSGQHFIIGLTLLQLQSGPAEVAIHC